MGEVTTLLSGHGLFSLIGNRQQQLDLRGSPCQLIGHPSPAPANMAPSDEMKLWPTGFTTAVLSILATNYHFTFFLTVFIPHLFLYSPFTHLSS